MVAGSDRVAEFTKLLTTYNGQPDKKGNILYDFDSVKVVSAGEGLGTAIVSGKLAQVWTIESPILTGINFGDLDYGSEDTNLITIDLEYDSCTLTTQNITD